MTIKTDKGRSPSRGQSGASAGSLAAGRASAIIRCRRHLVESDADRLCPWVDRRPEPCLAARRPRADPCQTADCKPTSASLGGLRCLRAHPRSSRSLQLSRPVFVACRNFNPLLVESTGKCLDAALSPGRRLTHIARACSAGRRASGSPRPHAANRVREFSAFRRKVQSLARRASPSYRGQSYQADRHR